MNWNSLWKQRMMVISGPCSAESPEQLYDSCKPLADSNKIHLLRAGIWKPRTRPNTFEGVGGKGLKWLVDVGKELNLPVCTEVASPAHVEKALNAGVDVLWIGARTTVNPFSVQAIADALVGVGIPVMVKNPINPDLQLWIGAIERLKQSGIDQIAAIHRGFSIYGESKFRNKPMWEIAIGFRTWFQDIPILCDPSHIGGRREIIREISQKALDLGYDGLMIESHIRPDQALSDARQQVTPLALIDLLEQLVFRTKGFSDRKITHDLAELRDKINQIDEDIIALISSRMEIAQDIGQYKRDHEIQILQLARWKNILETRTKLGLKSGLSTEFLKNYLEQIHKESIRIQTKVMCDDKSDDEVMW